MAGPVKTCAGLDVCLLKTPLNPCGTMLGHGSDSELSENTRLRAVIVRSTIRSPRPSQRMSKFARKQPVRLFLGLSSLISDFPKNISVPIYPKSILGLFASHPTRGAYRDRHGRGVRMRWTRQRFARDGIAGRVERLVSDQQHADERRCSVRRSRVVLTPRRWRQVRGCYVGPTGLRHNVSPWTTVAKEPGHRGEHEGNR